MPAAHRDLLDDEVALGDLLVHLEAEVGERLVEPLHRLPHRIRPNRQIGVLGLVVGELRMHELVHHLEIALRVDLLERTPREPLVVLGHGASLEPLRLPPMSRAGTFLVDIPEATVKVLADFPDFVLTYMRSQNEGGPGRHLHRQHVDGFVVLEGEYAFELGDERNTKGAGTALVIPQRVIHRYEHETTEQGAFLNIHAPGCDFANYLFGETPAEEADNIFDPPEEEGRPASEATVLRFAEQGEVVTDRPERTIRILADTPELCLTWTRYVQGEEGPGPHVHHEHVDAFFMLTGELNFGLGPEVERVKAGPGTFIAAPPQRDPHLPQRRPGRRHLAEFPRTVRGFRELPARSGLLLG